MRVGHSYITLHDVRLTARHGVMEQERTVGADYSVTLRVEADVSRAVETDSVEDTVNYAELYQLLCREMQQPSCLLEHAAGRIGQAVFSRYPQVASVDVRLCKLNPPMGADCGGASIELHLINDKTHA
ncbi:MAG: dihydroneopterin aldolase [Prevotella sp.]|nr:dihydroneopterin aldolase [Prevotella sp.]